MAYKIKSDNPGKCLIFVNETFLPDLNLQTREGAHKDLENLINIFSRLKFKISYHKDKTFCEIEDILKEVSGSIQEDDDCFVCCFSSHGNCTGALYARDTQFSAEVLYRPFLEPKCENLIGKPKVFIIQACYGSKIDTGIGIESENTCDSVRSIPFKTDGHINVLSARACGPSCKSYRLPGKGSAFITALKDVFINDLKESKDKINFLDLLNKVHAEIASKDFGDEEKEQPVKQMPIFLCSLTNELCFDKRS